MPFDWHEFQREQKRPPAMVDPQRRLRISLAAFLALLTIVALRLVQQEASEGAAFRTEATRPVERLSDVPAARGRILACDGTVLAQDEAVLSLTVHYRYLEAPADARWLRQTARARLPKSQRGDAALVKKEQQRLEDERLAQQHRLAERCGLSWDQWNARRAEIQARVERIAARAKRATPAALPPPTTWRGQIARALGESLRTAQEPPPATPITVAEELQYHVMVESVPAGVAAEIERDAARYPGVRIAHGLRRVYPGGALAAHVLGYLGPPPSPARGEGNSAADALVGRAGVERQYENVLRGRRGIAVELTDHSGRILGSYHREEPHAGGDVVLTLHAALQRTAEELLDAALQRRKLQTPEETGGGAVLVMDARSGALVAAVSAPRFTPETFVRGPAARRAALLVDGEHPLLDRGTQMALPPGSVFKTLTAMALLESGVIGPDERPFVCQGYLRQPDQLRCALYVDTGRGHGEVTLPDALAQSCNVYFFHYAEQLPPGVLGTWAARLAFGRRTGVDLPGEGAGALPSKENRLMMAIGQGALTVTPLQVLRMMAAVANGGQLVTPHVFQSCGTGSASDPRGPNTGRASATLCSPRFPSSAVPELKPSTLAAIREGLRRVVADEKGTAHATIYLESIAVAGKTGTASVGETHAEHAWFAGYVPAAAPKFALVVVLEHAGDAAATAGPVVKRLVLRMEQLGLLSL